MKKFLIIFILLTWDVDTSSQNDDKQSNIIETNSGKIQEKKSLHIFQSESQVRVSGE